MVCNLVQPPNWPAHYTIATYSNNWQQWSSQRAENSPAGPVRGHFQTVSVSEKHFCGFLPHFSWIAYAKCCGLALKLGFPRPPIWEDVKPKTWRIWANTGKTSPLSLCVYTYCTKNYIIHMHFSSRCHESEEHVDWKFKGEYIYEKS